MKKRRTKNRQIQRTIFILLVLALLPALVFAAVQHVTVLPAPSSIIVGQITYSNNDTGMLEVSVNLTDATTIKVISTTHTNETGYYNFTNVTPGDYHINASKLRYWDNSTKVEVAVNVTANLMLWLVGDLNNDGKAAQAGDLTLMNRVVLWKIAGDWRYDLNRNGIIGDAGDLVLMNRAVLGEIILA